MVKIIKHWHRQAPAQRTDTSPQPVVTEESERSILREKAYNEGFAQGLKDGRISGRQEQLSHYQALCERLKALIDAIPPQSQAALAEQSPQIIELLASILPRFFIQHAISKENIEHAINTALQEVDQNRALILLLSAEDYALLQQEKIHLPRDPRIQIKASAQVQLGGCLIESEQGVVDARLEQQIDQLKAALLHYKKQVSHEQL
ncbi:MAG: hypothetical protein JJT82_06060 [Legionellaceae bacterium]|nr:hypothetical protein [Legionellaceae bacterium]